LHVEMWHGSVLLSPAGGSAGRQFVYNGHSAGGVGAVTLPLLPQPDSPVSQPFGSAHAVTGHHAAVDEHLAVGEPAGALRVAPPGERPGAHRAAGDLAPHQVPALVVVPARHAAVGAGGLRRAGGGEGPAVVVEHVRRHAHAVLRKSSWKWQTAPSAIELRIMA